MKNVIAFDFRDLFLLLSELILVYFFTQNETFYMVIESFCYMYVYVY